MYSSTIFHKTKAVLLLSLFLFKVSVLLSQSSLSARVLTVSAHPFAKENLVLHKNTLDNKGYLTFEPGLVLSYDRYLVKKLSLRVSAALMNDRYNTLAGYGQIMLKYKLFKYYKHSLYLGFGPAIFFETDKSDIPNYVNEAAYKTSPNTMYKFGFISGMIEYNYYISKELDFALSLNHTHARSFALSLGVRIDIPDPNGKGCDCPSFR